MIYSIHGDDAGFPRDGVSTNSPLRHYGEDRLLPCEWDKHLFNASAKMPFGHLIRTDPEGRSWELIAGGLRNPFGIDFNERGDLFTFDADMEWDAGMPWYHPTRVLHLVQGGDYGWRRGTGVLPDWSPDTLPSAVNIGLGSPTAVKFGTKSNFPEPWRSALFILDWAYGKIYAVHLRSEGASYIGKAELFLKGRPLNVTGIDFGPDGAMYFVTGGRRTQSGLYRVSSTTESAAKFVAPSGPVEAKPSRKGLQGRSLSEIWSALGDQDHWARYAARVELEMRPLAEWSERALTEKQPTAALTALLALARVGDPDARGLQSAILTRVRQLSVPDLGADQKLIALRGLAVCCIRMGKPDATAMRDLKTLWETQYPSADARVNQSLCELLVYFESPSVITKTLPLIDRAETQEEKLQYLFTLRLVKTGWTLDERRRYFTWLARARREFHGAKSLPTALNYIRAEAEATLSDPERAALAGVLKALDTPVTSAPAPIAPRAFVRQWEMDDFDGRAVSQERGNRARGQRLFTEIGCAQCHRVGNEGGLAGPDLTAVGARFDQRALLESIVEPSKVIADVYRNVTIVTKSGAIYDGRVLSEDASRVTLATNPADPDSQERIPVGQIVSRRTSDVSAMPEGLLNTLSREEIFDLLEWLEDR
jgi:putative heme-binding domain-containing protein